MNIDTFRKSFLATFLAVGVALVMLPGCSSTSESGGGGTDPTSQSYDECIANCPDGDFDCREKCAQDLPF